MAATLEAASRLEPIIGLEIHAQVLTASKMYCGCSARYADAPPNTHVCPICSGMPGSLPVINRKAVELALLTAIALHCEIPATNRCDRKNYPYPDIPKGYQISQYDMPIGLSGSIDFSLNGQTQTCGITRVHLEEDTGKSLHTTVDGRDVTLVDYNRSGTPLLEIVTDPSLHSAVEARELFASVRQLLMYLNVCDGKLQEGSMRGDLNVSLRHPASQDGRKVEIKNLNSFRAVQLALESEIERQHEVLASGGSIEQETRGWVEKDECTVSQRTKEFAHDYRYFPEPDLPPVSVSTEQLERLKRAIPELPDARDQRFQEQLGLSGYVAGILTSDKQLGDFFEKALDDAPGVPPASVANWVMGDVLRLLRDSGRTSDQMPLDPASLGSLVNMVENGTISGSAGKTVLEEMFKTGEGPEEIVDRLDLKQLADEGELEALVDGVLQENPALVDTYQSGKKNAIQALIGKTMQASRGKANPAAVRTILEKKLDASD